MISGIADAYDRTGAAWQAGPGLIYDRLADVALDRCPIALAGVLVLDVGAGTGAASRAASRRGASVVGVDAAFAMLAAGAAQRPPAAVADALVLPFRSSAFDAAVAAFSLNHLEDPATALRETARVVRTRGAIVATAYASDDTHPVKEAVDAAASARGWVQEPWCSRLRTSATPLLATVARAAEAAADAGLDAARVDHVAVPFPDLGPQQLVAWRLGMAQMAPFAATLTPAERAGLVADALARLGADFPMLVRSFIVLTAVVGG